MQINENGETAFKIDPREAEKPFFISQKVRNQYGLNKRTIEDILTICRDAEERGRIVEIFIGEKSPVFSGYGNDLLNYLATRAVFNIRYKDDEAYEPTSWDCYYRVSPVYLEHLCQDFLDTLWDGKSYDYISTIDYMRRIREGAYDDMIAVPDQTSPGGYHFEGTHEGVHCKICIGRPGEKADNPSGYPMTHHGHAGYSFSVVFTPIEDDTTSFVDFRNRLFWPDSYIRPLGDGAICYPVKGVSSVHSASSNSSHIYYTPKLTNTVKGVGDFATGASGVQNLLGKSAFHTDDCVIKRPIFWNEIDAIDERIWGLRKPIGTIMTNNTIRIFADPKRWVTVDVATINAPDAIFFPTIFCVNRNELVKKIGQVSSKGYIYTIFGGGAELVIPDLNQDTVQNTQFNIKTNPKRRMA